MMRVIVTPAVLPPDALSELKDWLGITTTLNDGELTALLATAVDVCADFTGLVPLACGCEETLPLPLATGNSLPPGVPPMLDPSIGGWPNRVTGWSHDWRQAPPGWQMLSTRPVQGVSLVMGVAIDGTRTALDPATYDLRIDAEGGCSVRVRQPGNYQRCVVQFTAGLAQSWAQLPNPIRQGIIYLAAFQLQTSTNQTAAAIPPASVTALWLPWRRVRLS